MDPDNNPNSDINPFQPPIADAVPARSQMAAAGGIFRQGDVLVVHKNAELPNRCIKSNEPATRRLKRQLYWHHPLLYLLILANLLIYVIVAMIVRKKAKLYVGLSEKYHRRRINNMMMAWAWAFGGIALFIVGVSQAGPQGSILAFGMLLGPIMLITGALWGLYGCRVVYPKLIDNEYVWLKGVCPQFLAEYEEIPI